LIFSSRLHFLVPLREARTTVGGFGIIQGPGIGVGPVHSDPERSATEPEGLVDDYFRSSKAQFLDKEASKHHGNNQRLLHQTQLA